MPVSFHLYFSFVRTHLTCVYEQGHKDFHRNIVVISKRRKKNLEMTLIPTKGFLRVCVFALVSKQCCIEYNSLK